MCENRDSSVNEHELEKRLQEAQYQLSQLQASNRMIWELLVRLGSRLQRSSTSIKTAVSSLLDYDIFWDETTQYEFLQAIDSSADELADLIILMTLAFRSQAKTLEIETEPNAIQEILVSLRNNLVKNERSTPLTIEYPSDGKPALVDYQYLAVALSLLIEVIIGEDKNVVQLSIQATEAKNTWRLQITGLNKPIIAIIRHFFGRLNDIAEVVKQISPENALKLMTGCRILHLQNIKLCPQDTTENPAMLCLLIPTVTNSIFIA